MPTVADEGTPESRATLPLAQGRGRPACGCAQVRRGAGSNSRTIVRIMRTTGARLPMNGAALVAGYGQIRQPKVAWADGDGVEKSKAGQPLSCTDQHALATSRYRTLGTKARRTLATKQIIQQIDGCLAVCECFPRHGNEATMTCMPLCSSAVVPRPGDETLCSRGPSHRRPRTPAGATLAGWSSRWPLRRVPCSALAPVPSAALGLPHGRPS